MSRFGSTILTTIILGAVLSTACLDTVETRGDQADNSAADAGAVYVY